MSVFELIMLACFGISWPISVMKTIKTKTTQGKSIVFMCIIFTGYVSGIIHKLVYSNDPVLFLYIFNICMVSLDICLFFHYGKKEKLAAQTKED